MEASSVAKVVDDILQRHDQAGVKRVKTEVLVEKNVFL